jgi:predicted O-methyltransferase YrrM
MFDSNLNGIEKMVDTVLHGSGDSDKHVMTLFSIALGCGAKNIIELGVRGGDTTIPLLEAAKLTNGTVYSVDISEPPKLNESLISNWVFSKKDAIEFLEGWDVDKNIDLVYIDDWHSYAHVKKELELLDSLVSPGTVILLHDLMYGESCPVYHCDLTMETGQWAQGGPYRAVAELNPQFWEFATLPWNNGLTVLRKKYSSKYKRR